MVNKSRQSKVVILGSSGFIGKNWRRMADQGYFGDHFKFFYADIHGINETNFSSRVDVGNVGELTSYLKSVLPDYIVNLVGVTRSDKFGDYIQNNVVAVENLFNAVKISGHHVKNILLIGSASEYGRNGNLPLSEDDALFPVNMYGLSKKMQIDVAELYFRNFGISYSIARTFNIIGPNQPRTLAISSFIAKIREAPAQGVIEVGNLDSKRDFLAIEDVVLGHWKVLTLGQSGAVYNVCSGKSLRMREILDYLIRESGKKLTVKSNVPVFASGEIDESCGNNARLRDLGWVQTKEIFHSLKLLLEDGCGTY